jgi:hypothetical protein
MHDRVALVEVILPVSLVRRIVHRRQGSGDRAAVLCFRVYGKRVPPVGRLFFFFFFFQKLS